jgi:pimeloyl-ACP methyl ester carboxylesterase
MPFCTGGTAVHGSLTLSDGRRLAYTDIGRRDGSTILYFHGTPGSRLEVIRPRYLEAFAKAGIRLISVDRPGFGDSDPPLSRGHAGFASDIDTLLNHLGIRSAVAIGNSRGTLPAIAVGALLSHMVKAVGVFGPTGLPDDPELMRPLPLAARSMLCLVKSAPAAARALLHFNAWLDRCLPGTANARISKGVPSPADREQLRSVGHEWADALAKGMRRDPAFAVNDWRSWLVDPLGFDPASVSVPVLLWTGSEDRTCPPDRVPYMARRIPGAQAHTLPGVGHLHSPSTLLSLMKATLDAAGSHSARSSRRP